MVFLFRKLGFLNVSYWVLELINLNIITVKELIEGFLFGKGSKRNVEVDNIVLLDRILSFM